MSKTTLIIVAIISLLVVAIVGFYANPFKGEQVDIRRFIGNIVSIEGDIITLQGFFDGPTGTIPEKLLSKRSFSFRVNGNTIFEKLVINLPSWENLTAGGATSGTYKLQDLQRIEGEGSLDDMKSHLILNDDGTSANNIHVEADFPVSVYNSKNPAASRIFYQVMARSSPVKPVTQ